MPPQHTVINFWESRVHMNKSTRMFDHFLALHSTGQMHPGSDFTQTATCRSFLLARTGWFSILLNIGSSYCLFIINQSSGILQVELNLVQKKAISIMFPILIQQAYNRLHTKSCWVFAPVCSCEHFSHHAPWFCLSVSVTNMLSYTQYHCHLVPRAFLASSAGAENSAPPPTPPAHLWMICHAGSSWGSSSLEMTCGRTNASVAFVGGLQFL